VPDINRHHMGGPPLQQTIRETTGGRTQIQGGEIFYFEVKVFQRVFQFMTAAADEFLRRVEGAFTPARFSYGA